MTRNLVRFVDQFPGIYVVGTVCIFLSRRHQRLGDMAAGTLVVHEREHLSDSNLSSSLNSTTLNLYVSPSKYPSHSTVSQLTNAIPTPNLARLGPHDLQVLEAFFARRLDFSLELRQSLAHRLAHSIAAKAQLQIPPNLSTELFLEQVAHQLRDLSRLH
jgi:hypothetical protein